MKTSIFALSTVGLLLTSAASFAAGTHPETGEALADDQTFSYRLLDDVPTLDPQLIEDVSGSHVARQLFEGLLNQNAPGDNIPGVATEWEASEGNTVWTFKLRENAKWSNGDPVTAHDFVYAWQRAADPATASPYAWYMEITEIVNAADIVAGNAAPDTLGVEAVDDYTLKVTLNNPLPYFPSMTTHATLFPTHKGTIEAHGDDWTRPGNLVGNGAYVLESRSLGEGFTMVKNDMYWDAENTIITEINGVIVNDSAQALTRYEAGEYDLLEPVPAGQFPRLQQERPDEAHSVPRLCSYYYAINVSDSGPEALKDERVREALSYAVDRDVIVDQILKGGQTAAYSFTHIATAGFEAPEIDYGTWSQAERDAKAKELIEAARADGVPVDEMGLDILYNTSDQHKQIATLISQMWKQKLGVEAGLENQEWATYLETRSQQDFDVARAAWCADYNEASTFLDLMTTTHGSNDGKYSNAEVDQLMKASKTSDDPQPNYTRVEEIIADEMGMIPIYHYANTFLLDASLKGFPYENAENNWYVKEFYRVAD
ncbi:oligopeptide ABC transporter substrate-binding protein OppA [Alphaproteobacteria bacterium GH1-50]|uniref:Oligopeptide ABC transporter substrate-binding protein OppA n=1 Tax=Kangsaoukella pontilimi TaxID=2691042 RepID=A0A7C9IMU5_9RHOB|nr:peptide ABC transporter substrate-binding protein [Kangsaoukella pontilimi]MXQ06890.1 oligopeptide ABC transporter substrate-binding protein OppA [Kangsaoukella pontilimi]